MQPGSYEIDAVGNALILISSLDYNSPQQKYLYQFLSQYARNFDNQNERQVKTLFHDKLEVLAAIKNLHDFAEHYQAEPNIFGEFKVEIEDLLVALNQKNSINQNGLII